MNNPPDLDTRTWLAGLAMQAICTNPGGPIQANPMSGTGYCNCTAQQVGEWAVEIGDAVLAALAQSEPQQAEAKLPEMAEQSQRHYFNPSPNPDMMLCCECGKHWGHPVHIHS